MCRGTARWIITTTIISVILAGVPGEGLCDGLRAVQNRVAGVLAHPALRGAEVGALITSADRGDEIYRLHAERSLIPASNMKLVTVATAFELLSADCDCSAVPGAQPGETLAQLAHRILKPSDNALANALLEALPETAGRMALSPEQLCTETWGERGVYLFGTHWADGSGLSREGQMSPEVIVRLLQVMDHSRWRRQFISALPIAGVDGSLRTRMRWGQARGRVQAKTGTLTGVCALSGYATTIDGERLIFSLVMNGFACDKARVRRMQDHVCEALVKLEREGADAERAACH